jgi:anti-sigma regulatory factor (Ser/Thr protein kinase)
MTRVVDIPAHLDDRTFDQFAQACAAATAEGGRLLLDAHAAQWASPYGLVGLLCAGEALAAAGGERPLFTLPTDRDVVHYWARTGFLAHADAYFELHGKWPRSAARGSSDVLLDVTRIASADDVHEVVEHIQERAQAILIGELGLDSAVTMGFGMALSEACQNIVEHAGTGGWVAVQAYTWRRRLKRRVVVIAVGDAGVGFRRSLEAIQAREYGDRWNDGTALEAALVKGVSRFRDPGRGQGLAGIRRYLGRWDGKLSVRSGTARFTLTPSWDDDPPLAEGLPPFPGSQVLMIVPAHTDKATR